MDIAELTELEKLLPIAVAIVGIVYLIRRGLWYSPSVKSRRRLFIVESLAEIVNANLPIQQGLEQLEKDAPFFAKKRIAKMRRELESGSTLADAMSKQRRFFTAFCINLVRIGENTGQLGAMLSLVSDTWEADAEAKRELRDVISYPIYVLLPLTVAMGLLSGFMVFVSPKFEALFRELELHSHSKPFFVYSLPPTLRTASLIFIMAIIALWLARKQMGHIGGAKFWIPLFGPIMRNAAFANFCRILANVLEGIGVLPRSLELTSQAMTDAAFKKVGIELGTHTHSGASLGDALERTRIVPSTGKWMLSLGEQNGELPMMLRKAARFYSMKATASARTVRRLSGPIAVVGVGLIVGGFGVSVFSALRDLAELFL